MVGAPSWVLPLTEDNFVGNCTYLADKVDRVQILCFEKDQVDQLLNPADVARLVQLQRQTGLEYTVHLPSDLELLNPADTTAQLTSKLATLVRIVALSAALKPSAFILHLDLPEDCTLDFAPGDLVTRILSELTRLWPEAPGLVCLENTNWDLTLAAEELKTSGFGVCADFGHLHHQGHSLPCFLEVLGPLVREVHLHGFNALKDHQALADLPANDLVPIRNFVQSHRPSVTIENFQAARLEQSLETLATWFPNLKGDLTMLATTLNAIHPLDETLTAAAWDKMNYKTKPQGSLGRLEAAAVRLCRMQGTLSPSVARKSLVVFAGDHGVAREGVSAFPAEVTPQMVLNFLRGGAAINVLCRQHDIGLWVADVGVDAEFEPHPRLIQAKVRRGTRNFLKEPALTRDEAKAALEAGIRVFQNQVAPDRPQLVAVGEMGIGNTTAASALIAVLCRTPASLVTGRGTGIDDATLRRKVEVIEKALALHQPNPDDALDTLTKVGGLEIAGIAGFILGAAAARVPVVVDGLISTAGALVAARLSPAVREWLFSGHRSVEKGQAIALEALELEPLVDLGLRLGEGTGAALAMGLLDSAARLMVEMASFADAAVTNRD